MGGEFAERGGELLRLGGEVSPIPHLLAGRTKGGKKEKGNSGGDCVRTGKWNTPTSQSRQFCIGRKIMSRSFVERFFPVNNMYDAAYRKMALETAIEVEIIIFKLI